MMKNSTLQTRSVEGNESIEVDFQSPEFDDRQFMPKKLDTTPRNRRFAVIMAGGSGTRFWPWSRIARPKQMLPLASDVSMLADTVARVAPLIPRENILIVTAERLRRAIHRDIPELKPNQILAEPVGRNTAPCVAWAAIEILRRNTDAVMAVLPADHVVAPQKNFLADLELALTVADRERHLVTFGIRPDRPETGYGYIRAGRALAKSWPRGRVRRVASFHEKPTLARARAFLRQGDFFWNSGMFAWRADVILEELMQHLPELAGAIRKLDSNRSRGRIAPRTLARAYPRLPAVSIDHGVMEKSERVAVVPASFTWNDIGGWDAVASLWPKDRSGNASRDPVIAVDAKDNVVATHGKPVALLGVSGLAIVDAGDAILVCPRDRAQDVRAVVAALEAGELRKLR